MLAAAALAEQGLKPEQYKTLAGIQSSARRLTALVDDILDFARGRLGVPMPINRMPVNLGSITRDMLDEVRATNSGCSIDFQAEGSLNGNWDANRLKQVVANLVINAIQHGAGNRVTVRVRSDDTSAILEVHNQGPPIPAEMLPSMFDPLVRSSHSSREGGLGLGLFIADEIVSAHKGKIAVTSSQETGTTFVVRLPLRDGHEPRSVAD